MLREEKETIIRWDEAPKGKATLFTYNESLIRKLDSYMANYPDDVTCVRRDKVESLESVTYLIPKRWVKISPPRKMSEENKAKQAERMRAMQAKRKAEASCISDKKID